MALTPEGTTIRFGTRSMLVAVGLLACLSAGYGWLHRRVVYPQWEAAALQTKLESLANRRPKGLSQKQWQSAVYWTLNLHGNSVFGMHGKGPVLNRLNQRLDERLNEPINLDTIHWIWDEYAGLNEHGASYQRFRPVMLEEIEDGGVDWGVTVR